MQKKSIGKCQILHAVLHCSDNFGAFTSYETDKDIMEVILICILTMKSTDCTFSKFVLHQI